MHYNKRRARPLKPPPNWCIGNISASHSLLPLQRIPVKRKHKFRGCAGFDSPVRKEPSAITQSCHFCYARMMRRSFLVEVLSFWIPKDLDGMWKWEGMNGSIWRQIRSFLLLYFVSQFTWRPLFSILLMGKVWAAAVTIELLEHRSFLLWLLKTRLAEAPPKVAKGGSSSPAIGGDG